MEKLMAKFGDAFLCHRFLVRNFDSTNFHSKAILPKEFVAVQRSEAKSGKGARKRT